ncbi:MAG: hypothetical protein GKR93_19385 [Gammaproteobacteria bacterium]|nr:hypothetical protein [Gammaproteobacteria bacterium]
MDRVTQIQTALEIKPEAKGAIEKLLSNSNHPNPVLAILYSGSGTCEEDVVWKWELTTINSGALMIISYLGFEVSGFTFYSTYEDLEALKNYLDNMTIDVIDDRLEVVLKKSGNDL